MLCEATTKGVINLARYYYHKTVQVGGLDDDIRINVRKGLDITVAENYKPKRSMLPPSTIATGGSREGRNSSFADLKRSSSRTDAPLPPNKQSCSASPTKGSSNILLNRVHRRVILRDYGKPIYMASSLAALVLALEGCIEGHESLHKACFLHRDISINNLMINQDVNNPSWPSFLIDFDLAITEQRQGASGAQGITGTKAFIAIGALIGERHSYMHDLESFFWVLFWMCIHYTGPGKSRVIPLYDQWNYMDTEQLAIMKSGVIGQQEIFERIINHNFTVYYQPLLNGLRKIVFPGDKAWKMEDETLYSRMRKLLQTEWQHLK